MSIEVLYLPKKCIPPKQIYSYAPEVKELKQKKVLTKRGKKTNER